MTRRSKLGWALIPIAAMLVSSGCDTPDGVRPRALVVAVDGASLRVIDPMLEQGLLPHLAAIRSAGVSGPIESYVPALSPPVWTSVATGKPPGVHGITGWVWKDERGTLQLFSSRNRTAHAIWNILSDHGFSVGVVNWLVTHPPERIDGVMISDFAFPVVDRRREVAGAFGRVQFPESDPDVARPADEHAAYTYPPAWMTRVEALQKEMEDLTPVSDPFAADDGELGDYLSTVFAHDAQSTRMALAIQREIHPDLLLVYLPGIDRVSHFIWSGAEPIDAYPEATRLSPEEHDRKRTRLRDYYRYVDGLIGLLAADYTDDDLVMVLSDHGFEAGSLGDGQMPGVHETEAAKNGIFFARGRGIPVGASFGDGQLGVSDVTPTLLAWFGLERAEDMEGVPAPFLDVPPTGVVATHDTTTIERMAHGDTRGVEQSIKLELESLGYIDAE